MFKPTNSLEHALIAAIADAGTHPAFYKAILDADLIVAGTMSGPLGRLFRAKPGTKLAVEHWRASNGTNYIPIFSSVERLQAVNKTARYVQMNGRSLFEMFHSGDNQEMVVLNPGSTHGKEFAPSEIKGLLDGTLLKPAMRTVTTETQIVLGQPSVYPQAVVEALRTLLHHRTEVDAAYLAQMFDPKSGEPPHLLIGVKITQGDFESLAGAIGLVVSQTAAKGEFAEIIQITNSSISDYFTQGTTPFYQR